MTNTTPIKRKIKKLGSELVQSSLLKQETILDYWRWAHSDILGNTERGIFAEFLVGSALGLTKGVRTEWDPYDLNYGGLKIEVKSSAYLQTWTIDKESKIKFSIGAKRHWDVETRKYSEESIRHADLYVFCLLECKDKASVNPLITSQWSFYILSKRDVEVKFRTTKSAPLEKLIEAKAIRVNYANLRATIDEIRAGLGVEL